MSPAPPIRLPPKAVAFPDAVPGVGDRVRLKTGMFTDARGTVTRKFKSKFPCTVPPAARREGVHGHRVEVDIGLVEKVVLNAENVEVFDVPYRKRR